MLGLILGQGMLTTALGLAVGVGVAYQLSTVMSSLLFGVAATDPAIYVVVPIFLALVALGACFVPAWRATRVDPIVVLRYE